MIQLSAPSEDKYEQLIVLDLSNGEVSVSLDEDLNESSVVQVCTSLSDFNERLTRSELNVGMLFLSAFHSGEKIERFLAPFNNLSSHSLILIGSGLSSERAKILKHLPYSAAFEPSYSAAAILSAIQNLRGERRLILAARKVEPISTPCFRALKKLTEYVTTTDCSSMFSSSRTADFATSEFSPTHQLVADKLNVALKRHTPSSVVHIYRTCSISHKLLQKLDGSAAELIVVRNAAALLSSSFVSNSHLLKSNFSAPSNANTRQEIAELLRRTASEVDAIPELLQERNLLDEIAHYTLKDISSSINNPKLLPSLLFLTDLANRACWQDKNWNPRGAHAFLHEIGSSAATRFESEALAICLKMVCETIETRGAGYTRKYCGFPPAPPPNSTIQPIGEVFPLSQVLPGMTSNYPITTFDGKEVVPPNTPLDSDMIWRLWRLNALRPVNPIWIKKDPF
jgi:hypothetical protein